MNKSNLKLFLKIISVSLYIIAILIFVYGFRGLNLYYAYSSVFILFFANIIFLLNNVKKNILIIFFHITFFTFLLGRVFFELLNGNIYYLYNHEYVYEVSLILNISLIGLMIGNTFYGLFRNRKRIINKSTVNKPFISESKINTIKTVSFIFMLIAFFAMIIRKFEIIILMKSSSYTEWRLLYETVLPSIIIRLSNMYNLSFFVYLSSMPKRKNALIAIAMFLFIGFLTLLYGIRSEIVLNILFSVFYLIIRERFIDKERVNNKNIFKYIAFGLPFIPIILLWIGSYRYGNIFEFSGIISSFKDFFVDQGGTIDLIFKAIKYGNQLPQNGLYTIDGINEMIKNNYIIKLLFNTITYRAHTIERAIFGTSFGQTIAYYTMPTAYLSGIASGSSYLAEVYLDFGLFGILIINFIYGFILKVMSSITKKNIVLLVIVFFMVENLLYAPRAATDGFISIFLSFTNIVAILLMYIAYLILRNMKGSKRR